MPRQKSVRSAATVAAAIGALVLAGCGASPDDSAQDGVLASHDLDGMDGRDLVDRLDAVPVDERTTEFTAAVEADRVVVSTEAGDQESVALPDDEFYLAVAPYREQTHECTNHVPTGCIGELFNEEVDVTVTDDATGEVIVDKTQQTLDNGFLGLWLPADIDATITLEHEGDSVTAPISTGDDDPTCLTTLQLT